MRSLPLPRRSPNAHRHYPSEKRGGSALPSLPSSEASRATTSTSTVDQPGTEKEAQPAPSPLFPPQRSISGGGLSGIADRQFRPGRDAAEGCNPDREIGWESFFSSDNAQRGRASNDGDSYANAADVLRAWRPLQIHSAWLFLRRAWNVAMYVPSSSHGWKYFSLSVLGKLTTSGGRRRALHHDLPAHGRGNSLIHAGVAA